MEGCVLGGEHTVPQSGKADHISLHLLSAAGRTQGPLTLSSTHFHPACEMGRVMHPPLRWRSKRKSVCKLPGRTQDAPAVTGSNCNVVEPVRGRFLTKSHTSENTGHRAQARLRKIYKYAQYYTRGHVFYRQLSNEIVLTLVLENKPIYI